LLKIKTAITIGVFILSLLGIACTKKYKFTGEACDHIFHVEFYQVNSLGIDAVYLTDSSTFRFYLGTIDEGNEYFKFECKGDSINIKKLAQRGNSISDTVEILLNQETLSLKMLRNEYKY
jgi:hypothetical protein